MTGNDELRLALDTVARQVLANVVRDAQWDDYPDIGADDWDEIVRRAQSLAPHQRPADYVAAYKLLDRRAQAYAKEHPL